MTVARSLRWFGFGFGLVLAWPRTAAAAPPELATAPNRALPMALRGGSLTVAHKSYTLHGLPVRGAFATVLSEGTGEREVAFSRPRVGPQLMPAAAQIDAAEAEDIAAAHVNAEGPDEPGTLVYKLILGEPVLAYEVELPLQWDPEPSKKTIWVSASSGMVLDEWEHVRSSRARVFKTNPASTPVPVEVELAGIHATGPGQPLEGDRIRSFNCTLEAPPDDQIQPWWAEGKCYAVHRAESDENGDFFLPLPDVIFPEDNADDDDLYAELSMYYNAERFIDEMKRFGVDAFKCELSTMLANYRTTELSTAYPDLDYTPLNNAYWTNTCDPEKGPTMIFGQGAAVDFGYDGDVVYHELGHGMVSLLTPNGLGDRTLRPEGVLNDAGGLNEAIADYFSVILANEPLLGDYVARFWPGYGNAIRNAENTKRCPDNIVGQVHNDGEPFMGAMWAARKRIGREKMDPVIFELLPRLPGDADLETASLTVLEIAEEGLARGEWTESDIDLLVRAFDARGLYDCPRIHTDPDKVASGASLYLRGKSTAVTPFFPGPMQLRHEVPPGSDNVIVRFRLGGTSGPAGNPAGVVVLLKRADAPIQFEYTLTAVDKNPDGSNKGSVREVIQVTGDWDHQLAASRLGESDNQLVLRGFRPGEVVHVALANLTAGEQVASATSVVSVPPEFLDEGTVTVDVGPAEDTAGQGADAPEVHTSEPEASCACRSEGGAAAPLAALALLGLSRRRRRR
ncbi:MYXO-CTERM sorting domain-containing protein [Nannocystis radixulma]|uniref:MYXO-CTERM sorting domain-containing protein n=1 Tax=Nannocystis radixulma TaxID=2995305 RepID=A0ABT5BIM2_9BACT|nr:MYXO-CTERM sorting domain-containing protein [Nannocystis radixulma]MDC0674014.1 MYXO-CTERM sorting domain-containing protein [Nannocystis radixulma]